MPITRTILNIAQHNPDQLALVGEEGQRLTYAQLLEDSRRMYAAVLALVSEPAAGGSLGSLSAAEVFAGAAAVGAGALPPAPASAPEAGGLPIVAVSLTSAFHTSRIMAGLAGYPVVSATLDPRWPLDHQVDVIVKTGIALVLSDSAQLRAALAAAGWGGTVVTLKEFIEAQAGVTEPAEPPTVRADDEPFLMLFSSGTTSNPKAFMKTRGQYRANYAVSSAHLEPLPGVATLAPGPVSYSLTLYAVIECLASGGSVHVADAFEPAVMAARVRAEGITRVVAVPAVVQSLADVARRSPADFAGLELVVTGGANLPVRIRRNLAQVLPDTRLISYYGAAEIGFIGDSRGGDGTLIDVYPTITASVRDAAGEPVPDGETGTLWIHAAACSYGYVAATTDAVLVGPDGWATVGDQARIVDGKLELLGRAGDIVNTGGHKVSLPQVERAFDEVLGPGRACAIGLPSANLGSLVALVVEREALERKAPAEVPAEGLGFAAEAQRPLTKSALQEFAREHLAPQYVPRQWYLLDELPRTVGGKIRRAAATAAIEAGEGERL